MRRSVLSAVLLVAGLGFLTGCSGSAGSASSSSAAAGESKVASDTDAAATGAERSGTPTTVDCPGTAKAVKLPAGFLAPLPDGTVVVAVGSRSGGRTVVTGVVPGAEHDVLKKMQDAYLSAGLTLTAGETEPHDAESNFTGSAATGRWGIRALDECSPAATRIDVVVENS
ncbi:MAG TPA: hypothetical protein VGN47_01260 [Blastococcus sp.]|jgi:hypothetical protein|nr:hypothetical protein [Blastococcus sp.]